MNDLETIKMLYLEHHRQMTSRRQKIHGIAERAVAVLMIIGGWLILSATVISSNFQWIMIALIVVIVQSTCFSIYMNNKAYLGTAAVISKLNIALGLYEKGRYMEDESLYPEKGESLGANSAINGALPHAMVIVMVAALDIIAVVSK